MVSKCREDNQQDVGIMECVAWGQFSGEKKDSWIRRIFWFSSLTVARHSRIHIPSWHLKHPHFEDWLLVVSDVVFIHSQGKYKLKFLNLPTYINLQGSVSSWPLFFTSFITYTMNNDIYSAAFPDRFNAIAICLYCLG